jgi:hypothetical protein
VRLIRGCPYRCLASETESASFLLAVCDLESMPHVSCGAALAAAEHVICPLRPRPSSSSVLELRAIANLERTLRPPRKMFHDPGPWEISPLTQSRVRPRRAGTESHALMGICCWAVRVVPFCFCLGLRRARGSWLALAHVDKRAAYLPRTYTSRQLLIGTCAA